MTKSIENLTESNLVPVVSKRTYDDFWAEQRRVGEEAESLLEYHTRTKRKFEAEQPDLVEYFSEHEVESGISIKWQHLYQQYFLLSSEFEKGDIRKIPTVRREVIDEDIHPFTFGVEVPEDFEENMEKLLGFLKEENYKYFHDEMAFYNSNIGSEDERAISVNSGILLYFTINSQLKRRN